MTVTTRELEAYAEAHPPRERKPERSDFYHPRELAREIRALFADASRRHRR